MPKTIIDESRPHRVDAPHPSAGTGRGDGSASRAPAFPKAAGKELAARLQGPLFLPGHAGYPAERGGYNLAVDHRPDLLVGATGPADVIAAVDFATRHGIPVGVLNTGHTAAVPADGAMLVNTRRMQGVRVDPYHRVAQVEAGVQWRRVIHESAPFGLAPLNGSSPIVGVVGYTLGGGLGLLGRAHGYAADHVHTVDVVTAHGAFRHVTPQQYGDLFWAIRGGKGNFGVVTSIEIELFPVPRLYGGGLYFRGSAAPEVFRAYRRWARTVPDQMTSSIALTRFPWSNPVPELLRGRSVVHVRIAYHGTASDGEELVEPLRRITLALEDTVRDMPFTEAGSIHNDPVEPFALRERSAYLRDLDEDAMDVLVGLTGPDSSCPLRMVELRQLGGALGRPSKVPNAVGNRDAEFLLYLAGAANPDVAEAVDECADAVIEAMAPWSTGGVSMNFLGVRDAAPERVRAAYSAADYRRLVTVKRAYDPENLFRINHNIPPEAAMLASG
jgi:FAD/FMN-containing dehydrogenase